MAESPKLKPCPFCGSDEVEEKRRAGFEIYLIACSSCGISGPEVYSPEHQSRGGRQRELARRWNQRAPVADVLQIDLNPLQARQALHRALTELTRDLEAQMVDDEPPGQDDPPAQEREQEFTDQTPPGETPPAGTGEAEHAVPPVDPVGSTAQPPAGGGGEGTTDESAAADDWSARLSDWLGSEGLSPEQAAEQINISGQSIRNIVGGSKPGPIVLAKLLEFFGEPEPARRQLPAVPSPHEAAAFLQVFIADWMKKSGHDHDQAAAALELDKGWLLKILQCELPTRNILKIIADNLPKLAPQLPSLMQARKVLEKQKQRAASA